MPTSDEPRTYSLREALDWAHREARRDRRKRTDISHWLANSFMTLLAAQGIRILETGRGNANYFFMEVDGNTCCVSPFASHEEWWEKPSIGFRSTLKHRSCDWGVILFVLPKREGIWIKGNDFDHYVLRDKQKVNAADVSYAVDRGIAVTFREVSDFIRLVKVSPKRPTKPFLVAKGKSSHG